MNKAEDIRAIIVEAVQAGRVSAGHTAKDAFKATVFTPYRPYSRSRPRTRTSWRSS